MGGANTQLTAGGWSLSRVSAQGGGAYAFCTAQFYSRGGALSMSVLKGLKSFIDSFE